MTTGNRAARRAAAARARRSEPGVVEDPRSIDSCTLRGIRLRSARARSVAARAYVAAMLDGSAGALVHTLVRRDVEGELDTPIAFAGDDNHEAKK